MCSLIKSRIIHPYLKRSRGGMYLKVPYSKSIKSLYRSWKVQKMSLFNKADNDMIMKLNYTERMSSSVERESFKVNK